jgi:hypothetical protein
MSISQQQITRMAQNQLKEGALSVRKTYISLPEDAIESDPEMYWNGQILAVEGFSTKGNRPPKRHFCVLLNTPEEINSPSILKQEVIELYFKGLDEMKIPPNRELSNYTPVEENIQGYAFIFNTTPRVTNIPPVANASFSLKSQPEMNPADTKVLGNDRGGIAVNTDGDVHIISGDGSEVVFGAGKDSIQLYDKGIKGTDGIADNTLVINNPLNTGKMLGFPMPESIGLACLGTGKVPNIPEIANLALEVNRMKEITQGLADLAEVLVS